MFQQVKMYALAGKCFFIAKNYKYAYQCFLLTEKHPF